MLFKVLRGHLVVTVHVRSNDGHREVWIEEVDVVWFQRPCMTSDWRFVLPKWRLGGEMIHSACRGCAWLLLCGDCSTGEQIWKA